MRVQLPRITALRTFAAAAVLVYHLALWEVITLPGGLSTIGYAGVAFFFLLSGFVLAWGTPDSLSPLLFYRRRFARVWPSHMAVLLVAIAIPVVQVARGPAIAVPNALLLQSWSSEFRVVYGMNGDSWSLSCEAFFYLLFPLAAWLASRTSTPIHLVFVATALVLELVVTLRVPDLAEHLPLLRLPEFLLGLVAGRAFRNGWRPRVPMWLGLGTLLVSAALSRKLFEPLADLTLVLPFLLVLLAAADRDVTHRPGWLAHPILVVIGEASFAFYLVHELVIVNLRRALGTGPAVAAVILLLSVLTAAVLHLLIERPFNRLLRDASRSTALAVPRPRDAE